MPPNETEERTPSRLLLLAAVGVGVVARVVMLAQAAPLWGDEAMLAVGILRTGPFDVLHPLDYLQVAPPLFLLLLHAVVSVLGHAEWVLRLPAFAAAIATLYLLFRVAEEIGGVRMALTATILAAFSPLLLRYSGEVKQYAFDALFGVAIPWVVMRLSRDDRTSSRGELWAWMLAMVLGSVAAPVLVGGLFVAIVAVPQARRRVGWGPLLVGAGISAALYLALQFMVYRVNTTSPPMIGAWSESYLMLGRPGALGRCRIALQALASLWPSLTPLAREYRLALVALGAALLLRRRVHLGLAFGGPTLLAVLFSAVGLFPIAPRLLLFALPVMLLCLAQLLVALVPETSSEKRRAIVVIAIVGVAAASSLRMLPTLLPLSQLFLLGLLAVVIAPRLTPLPRGVVSVLLALSVTLSQGMAIVRHPMEEDGRTTIHAVLSQGLPALYIPAASAATWLYYSSPWTSEDSDRVDWYVAQARADGTAVPFSDNPAAPLGRAELWRKGGRTEVLGTWPGVVYRPPRGFISPPRAGWAQSEADRINSAVGSSVVIIETHVLPGATEALLASLTASGWQVDSTLREQTATATFLHRNR